MDRSHTTAVYVGIFTIVGFILLLWMSFRVEHWSLFGGPPHLYAEFDSVNGLRTGNPVTMRGVPIGRVGEITLDIERGTARTELLIEDEWPLSDNAVAHILQPDLFRSKTIDITYPSTGPSGIALADGATMQSRSSIDLATAMSRLGESVSSASDKIERLRNSVTGAGASAIERMASAVDGARGVMEQTGPLVNALLASSEAVVPMLWQLWSDRNTESD